MKSFANLWQDNDNFYRSLRWWEVFFKESVAKQKSYCLKKRLEFTLSRDRLHDKAHEMNMELDFKESLYNELS